MIEMNNNQFVLEEEGMDFYPIEYDDNDKGNYGMIVKINNEGTHEYKICADECHCLVECEYDNDCENGMECIEYECVDNRRELKNKKESIIYEKRGAIPMIVMSVPIMVCIMGVFTTSKLAYDYGQLYFSGKCKKKYCPSDLIKDVAEINVVEKAAGRGKIHVFICEGACTYSEHVYRKKVTPIIDEIYELYTKRPKVKVDGKMVEIFPEAIIALFFSENDKLMKKTCKSEYVRTNTLARDIPQAMELFTILAGIRCRAVPYEWEIQGIEKEFKSFDPEKFKDKICELDSSTVKCEEDPLYPV